MTAKKKVAAKKKVTKKASVAEKVVEAPAPASIDVMEDDTSEKGVFVLPRNLEISGITEVYRSAEEFIATEPNEVTLDAGLVALVDTAGVQFVIQFLRAVKARGNALKWINDSIQIYQMAAEVGLADELED